MKRRAKTQKKSLRLAIYFGLAIFFIFLLSVVFKGIDLIRESKFDGNNRFTVAVLSVNSTDIVSVSPENKRVSRLTIKDANSKSDISEYLIPIDSYVYIKDYEPKNTKSAFTNMLSGLKNSNTDLTVIDLLRLSYFVNSISNENIIEENLSIKDNFELTRVSSEYFVDPRLLEEGISIQITNSSDLGGFGKKLGEYITNLGGNVVLVNSSQKKESKTKLYYNEKSYTSSKVSNILNIPSEKKNLTTISDVIIIIGEDADEVLNL